MKTTCTKFGWLRSFIEGNQVVNEGFGISLISRCTIECAQLCPFGMASQLPCPLTVFIKGRIRRPVDLPAWELHGNADRGKPAVKNPLSLLSLCIIHSEGIVPEKEIITEHTAFTDKGREGLFGSHNTFGFVNLPNTIQHRNRAIQFFSKKRFRSNFDRHK